MSINDINNAAAAMNQLKARYEGFLDDADGQIAARRAAYDGLASDLTEVVEDRMSLKLFLDADAGDDSNSGTSGSPLKTLQEAYRRMVPGCLAELGMKRGGTFIVGRDDPCLIDNAVVYHYAYGDDADPMPVIQQYITEINNASYSSGFGGKSLQLIFIYIRMIVGMEYGELARTRYSGFIRGIANSSVTAAYCTIELGNADFIRPSFEEVIHVDMRSTTLVRQAGSDAGFLVSRGGSLRAAGVILPENETWTDLVSGILYAADGQPRNFITDIDFAGA
jgi:hypothetical protein